MIRHRSAFLAGLFLALSWRPALGDVELTDGRQVMGTVLSITLRAPTRTVARTALEAAFAEATRLDGILSSWKEDSQLARFNRSAGKGAVPVGQDLLEALTLARALHDQTMGAFDPTIGPVTLLHRKDPRPPRKDLARAVRRVNGQWLTVGDSVASLEKTSMAIDLGGLGKGYAADRLRDVLQEWGARTGLIDFGQSTLLAFGDRDWKVSLRGLDDSIREEIALRNEALSTSGSTGQEGVIFEPTTGEAVDEPRIATVRCSSAAEAEGWSTALVVLGRPGVDLADLVRTDMALYYEDSQGVERRGWSRP